MIYVENAKKMGFSFVFRSLFRTFARDFLGN